MGRNPKTIESYQIYPSCILGEDILEPEFESGHPETHHDYGHAGSDAQTGHYESEHLERNLEQDKQIEQHQQR